MKLVLITYNEAIHVEVLEMLDGLGVKNYTLWAKTYGRGTSSEPHLGTHIWPKANNVLSIGVENDVAARIMEGVRKLRQTLSREGVKAFLLPVEDVTL